MAHEQREQADPRLGNESVWVVCGGNVRSASAIQALAVAEAMMEEQRKRIASVHRAECRISAGKVCTCEVRFIRGMPELD